jgi:uncharacterized membrane protein
MLIMSGAKRSMMAMAFASVLVTACESPEANRTLAGGAIGAAGGAAIGALAGNAALGAGIGGAVGLAGGALSNRYEIVPRR